MKRWIITGIVLVVVTLVAGSLVEVQTARVTFPSRRTSVVIARRVVWPWADRWATGWVSARATESGYRSVESARLYGFLSEPSKDGGLLLDRYEGVSVEHKAE